MRQLKLILFICCFLAAGLCKAGTAQYGANFFYALRSKEPHNLKGYQLMLVYDPQSIQWRKFNIYFDGGFSHFWVKNFPYYRILNIYSIAPVVRYTYRKHGPILPYLEISIGFAYLNKTHIENRKLGIHFAFQDRIGVGTLWGHANQFSLGVEAIHYSNAHLSNHNSGVSIPVMLNLGYRF